MALNSWSGQSVSCKTDVPSSNFVNRLRTFSQLSSCPCARNTNISGSFNSFLVEGEIKQVLEFFLRKHPSSESELEKKFTQLNDNRFIKNRRSLKVCRTCNKKRKGTYTKTIFLSDKFKNYYAFLPSFCKLK